MKSTADIKGVVSQQTVLQPAARQETELVAEECAIALVYNGISHAVLMASPIDLGDLALGFSLSEAIVESPQQFYGCELEEHAEGIELQIAISNQAMSQLKQRRRFLMGASGCGLCGIDSLTGMQRELPRLDRKSTPSNESIENALMHLNVAQRIRQATGATHCAAAFDEQGELLFLREDIGRHNALDKLIGAHLSLEADVGFYLVSSRASYEMVAKTVSAGVSNLVCVSAPTSMAITTAEQSGLNLIAFARPDRYRIYSGFNSE